MTYTFRPITEADFDIMTDNQVVQDWLKQRNFKKEDYPFDLDFKFAQNVDENVSLMFFKWNRDYQDNSFLLKTNYGYCIFEYNDLIGRKKFPFFKIVLWILEENQDNFLVCNMMKHHIKEIFKQGNRFLTGESDDLDSELINDIQFD